MAGDEAEDSIVADEAAPRQEKALGVRSDAEIEESLARSAVRITVDIEESLARSPAGCPQAERSAHSETNASPDTPPGAPTTLWHAEPLRGRSAFAPSQTALHNHSMRELSKTYAIVVF